MPHRHKWEPIRQGLPPMLCRCGALRGRIHAGKNSITCSPSGVGDVVRWSANKAAVNAGDLGMDKDTGRASAMVSGGDVRMPMLREALGSDAHRSYIIQPDGRGTTLSLIGFETAPSEVGTPSNRDYNLNGSYLRYASGTSVDDEGGFVSSAFTETRFDYAPLLLRVQMRNQQNTNIRTWIGLFSSTPMASATPAVSYVGFRFSTDVESGNWRAVSDNGSGTPTVTDTGTNHGTNNFFRLVITVDSGGSPVRYYINDSLVATHTTTLPAGSTNLGVVFRTRTLTTAARQIELSRVYVAQRASAT